MPEIKAVNFDLDGTLVTKTNEVILDGLCKAVAQASGRTALTGMFKDIVVRYAAANWGDAQQRLNEMLPVDDPAALERASEAYDRYIRQNLPRRMEVVDGCVDALQNLKFGGMVLSLTTATPKHIVTEVVFPRMGVPNGLFKYIEAADSLAAEGGRPKPDPYTITKILNSENLEPEQAVMVGDSGVDVEAGRRAGVAVVVVETGILKRREAERLGVEHIIPNITYLPRVLEQMEQQAA